MGIDALLDWIIPNSRLTPKSVEQLMLPVTISGWIIGMGIIEFPLGNHWPIASLVYTLVLIIGYSSMGKIMIGDIDDWSSMASITEMFIFNAFFYSNLLLNICGILLSWIRIRHVKSIVDRLKLFDGKMDEMGMSPEYRELYLRQLLSLVFQVSTIFSFMIVEIASTSFYDLTNWQKISSAVVIYYPIVVISIGDLSFVTFVRFIALRFDQINKFLMKMSTTTDASPQHKRVVEYTSFIIHNPNGVFKKRTNDNLNAMKVAREYHHELVKIGFKINDTFGLQALLSMIIIFVILTGLLYRICNIVMWMSASQQLIDEELLNAMCWVAFYIYRIVIINSACAKASDVSRETGYIICHLHEPSTKKAYRDEICNFSLQIAQHTLTFTACGFFTLDYSLIHKMIASITTYLVILVQIGDTSTSEILANTTSSF